MTRLMWGLGLGGCVGGLILWAAANTGGGRAVPPQPPPQPPTAVLRESDAPRQGRPAVGTRDPSIPPDVLERAFAPPAGPLPSAARPRPAAITPPEPEQRRLEDDDDVLVY